MSTTVKIAPVRKTIVVAATPQRAFEVFTSGIDRWWPRTHYLGAKPIRESRMEGYAGGRWYAVCEDGTDVVFGHVRVWQPPERLVVSFESSADFKPDPRAGFTSEVEVRFVALAAGGTRLELEHRDFERMGAAEGEKLRATVDGGWPGLLELFAKQFSSGV